MNNQNLDDFLEGQLSPGQFSDKTEKDSVEKDFIKVYQKIIDEKTVEVPDFNAFEKIETARVRRISFVKRVLPYAASTLLVLSLIIVFQKYNSQKTTNFSEAEIIEIQQNTEMALLQFSKELNACLAKFENAKKIQQPLAEIASLKNIEIDMHNPIENIKIE